MKTFHLILPESRNKYDFVLLVMYQVINFYLAMKSLLTRTMQKDVRSQETEILCVTGRNVRDGKIQWQSH